MIRNFKMNTMALKQLIKLAIFLLIAVVIFNVLKQQSFFNTEAGKVSSASIVTNSQTDAQNKNEGIKDQLKQMASRTKMPYIAGCMKTPNGCQCVDAKGKVVPVSTNVCLQNVRDASSNQHKAFDATEAAH